MKKVIFIFLLSLQLLFAMNSVQADDFQDAWQFFKDNKLKDAKTLFEKSLSNPAQQQDALLMLSIIYGAEKNYEQSFQKFVEFFKVTEDPNPYIIALWVSASLNLNYGEKKDYQIAFYEELLESEKVNGKVRAYANEMLAMHYDAIGEFGSANNYYNAIGANEKWQLLGEFENISESGFDNNYGALEHPENGYVFTNEDGAKVKWFDAYKHQEGRWLRFNNFFYTNHSIFFAQSFCNSPTEQNVQLRIGVSGSLKVWVNDGLILRIPKERNNGSDTYISEITLNEGYNRILVQIGESENENSNFLMRITDKNGNPIENLEYTTTAQQYAKSNSNQTEPLQDDVEQFFRTKLKSDENNLLNYILLTEALLHFDRTFEARMVLKKSLQLAPNCTYLLNQLGNIYIREDNQTDLSLIYEKLKVVDPENPLSLDLFFGEALNAEKFAKADEYLQIIKDKFGENEKYLSNKSILLSKMSKFDEYIKLLDYSYEKYPEEYDFVYSKAIIEYKVNKRVQAAIDVIETYLDNHFSISLIEFLAELYFMNNNIPKGLSLLKSILDFQPNRINTVYQMGLLYYNLKEYRYSESYYSLCQQIAPFVDKYHFAMGELKSTMDENNAAIESYKKALELNPNGYTTREKYDDIMGNKKSFDYFEEPDYENIYKNSPNKDAYPEDNSVILIDESQRVVYPGGGSEERSYFMVKVFNPAGIDDWKEYSVNYGSNQNYTIEKAKVIKSDGTRLDAEVKDNYIVFTKLEENDAILVIYKIQNFQWGKLMNHFWDRHYFSSYYPSLKSKYSLLVPPNLKFDYKFINTPIEPKVTQLDRFVKYEWEKSNISAVQFEPCMPVSSDVLDILHISTLPDWDFVNKWYWDISKTKSKSDFEVKEIVEQLFKDKKNLSDNEKVELIYNYITKNIRYSSVSFRQSGLIPQKASKVINTKIGDCKDVSTLFVALCGEAGINANLVLVNTRDNGANDLPLPSIEFNHCIATVTLENDKRFVELTSDHLPFSTIYGNLKKAKYLEIDNKKIENNLVELNPINRKKNYISRETKVTFKDELMSVNNRSVKSGGYASGMRSTYRDIGEKARNKEMLEALSDDYADIALTELKFDETLNNSADTVNYIYNYDVKNPFTKFNNLQIFKLPLSDRIVSDKIFTLEERNHDIDLWNYLKVDYEYQKIEIILPSGFKISEVPANVEIKSDFANYYLKFKQNGTSIFVERYFELTNNFIPKKDYFKFKEFFQKIISSDAQQLALQKL